MPLRNIIERACSDCQWRLSATLLFAGTLASGVANATTLITFEGLANNTAVGNYYNGGAGGDLGITLNDRFQALIDSDAGGTGVFGGEPSPSTVAMIRPASGSSAVIDLGGGFQGSLSLFYSGPGNTVLLFDQTEAH